MVVLPSQSFLKSFSERLMNFNKFHTSPHSFFGFKMPSNEDCSFELMKCVVQCTTLLCRLQKTTKSEHLLGAEHKFLMKIAHSSQWSAWWSIHQAGPSIHQSMPIVILEKQSSSMRKTVSRARAQAFSQLQHRALAQSFSYASPSMTQLNILPASIKNAPPSIGSIQRAVKHAH